ncbi:MAG TPA: GYD domain-containing protein [Verrucomicrobiae bacterium]|nr:GYD domain-containing protein [Verrucomicrobiae bacterium]
MSHYCLQISFTTQAWNHLSHTPQDRFAVVRTPIEQLGGSIHATFFTTGRFDLLAIVEFPEHITPAEISVAFAHGGAVASINTSPLLTFAQAVDARNRELATTSCSVRTQRHLVAVAGS